MRGNSWRRSARRPTGTARPRRSLDPLIEPLWTGVRALAAVDRDGAVMVDGDGDEVIEMAEIIETLSASLRAGGVVLDGFLTKQTAHAAAVNVWPEEMPSFGQLVGLRRNRAVDTVKLKEDALAAQTFDGDEEVSFVATDLLWLDGTSLLDVPLLERRRLLESVLLESDRGSRRRVHPSADRIVGQFVALDGLRRADLQGRQQSLPARRIEPRLGDHRDASPLRWYGWANAPNRPDTGHPR